MIREFSAITTAPSGAVAMTHSESPSHDPRDVLIRRGFSAGSAVEEGMTPRKSWPWLALDGIFSGIVPNRRIPT